MATYAAGTNVSSERSRNEIERTLTRYATGQVAPLLQIGAGR